MFIYVLLFAVIPSTVGWHDLTNTDYHCWPLSASSQNPVPFAGCTGVNLRWILPPPQTVIAEVPFNTTYELLVDSSFYTWGFGQGIFNDASGGTLSDASAAETWCTTAVCPTNPSNANQDNCCVHHVNVHSCPLSGLANSLCGPWIPAQGSIVTHSEVMVGPVDEGNWTSYVPGLYSSGDTQMIAHFKIAGSSIALVKNIKVLPAAVCGDDYCDKEKGEDCKKCRADCGRCPLSGGEITAIVVAILVVATAFLGYILFSQYKQRKLLYDESWIVKPNEIKEDRTMGAISATSFSMMSLSNLSRDNSEIKEQGISKQIFTRTAICKGHRVAVKYIDKTQFALTKRIRMEVKQVRTLDHPNICSFVAGCIEVPHVCILTEYCAKGGLNDVLLNDEVPLSWSFRFSFATDIAKAMEYLHGYKIYHGRLNSSNCVVNDRWTVQITDFGLQEYRKPEVKYKKPSQGFINDVIGCNVYLAPECRNRKGPCQTPEGDVYAFAVILMEIANREDPSEYENFNSANGVDKTSDDYFHNNASTEEACPSPEKYCELVRSCWNHTPGVRPSFGYIKKEIRRINPDKRNVVDAMMAMMEKYSKHLEVIVGERTRDLVAEKQKTDRLLYSMMPKAVADELRMGNSVNAEQFDCCTIFFSDIVGFTTICAGSTAMEVIAMLNKLYVTFDATIDKFHVYKVETIGDAYMVVSGLPERRSDHAQEIANMALALVKCCEVFVIPHKKDEPLKIRVGIHSGSVCAGVVGLKMPRYCLFGDTVNTASRMESNGEAYKIHISESTYRLLLPSNAHFSFEARGTIPVKKEVDKKGVLISLPESTERTKEKLELITMMKCPIYQINGVAKTCLKTPPKEKQKVAYSDGLLTQGKGNMNTYWLTKAASTTGQTPQP